MSKLTISHILCLACLLTVVFATDITVFTDDKCRRSWRALDAVNGYPDGLCKPLNVTESQSFQIQELDLGCVGKYSFHQFMNTTNDYSDSVRSECGSLVVL
jgi:hypothetical protein